MKTPRRHPLLLPGAWLILLAASAGAVPAAGEAPAPATWTSPPGSSRAGFLLDTFWHGIEGTTTTLSARMESAGGDPLQDGRVEVVLDAASLSTGNRKRDEKMRESHLETDRFPSIRFISRSDPVRTFDAGSSVYVEVRGDLTLHGVTRPITVQVEAAENGDDWMMKCHFVVLLSEYKIPDPGIFLNKVRDEVDIYFEISLARDNAPAPATDGSTD